MGVDCFNAFPRHTGWTDMSVAAVKGRICAVGPIIHGSNHVNALAWPLQSIEASRNWLQIAGVAKGSVAPASRL